MRYAILSDIHANLEALTAVMARVAAEGIDRVIVLGDFVGYYPSPNECLDLLQPLAAQAVAGNHDLVAVGRADTSRFSYRARDAIEWTGSRLAAAHRSYLGSLPERAVVDGRFVICHGSLRSPHEYVRTAAEAYGLVRDLRDGFPGVRLCFFGHTHRGVAYAWDGEGPRVEEVAGRGELALRPGLWYAVNPGSVGQPRDGDRRASFLVHDAAASTVRFCRVEYDHDANRRKTLLAGLPPDGPHRPRVVRRLMRVLARARGR